MKNCDTCDNFVRHKNLNDGRKGLCEYYDIMISELKGKPCKGYEPKKYDRIKFKLNKEA